MPTKKRTVSVQWGASADRHLERAVSSYRRGERSFSELAGETGLSVEEIMDAVGQGDREAALAMFLASCKTVAESEGNPDFMRLGQAAVDDVRAAGG